MNTNTTEKTLLEVDPKLIFANPTRENLDNIPALVYDMHRKGSRSPVVARRMVDGGERGIGCPKASGGMLRLS